MDDQLETAVCRSPTLSLEAAVNYSNCTILQITLESVFGENFRVFPGPSDTRLLTFPTALSAFVLSHFAC